MTAGDDGLTIEDDPAASLYAARVGDRLAGSAQYRLKPGRIVFTHTEVDPAFEGHGVGGRLAAGALDDARRRGLKVVPICPFIRGYIERHPAYADLLDAPLDRYRSAVD